MFCARITVISMAFMTISDGRIVWKVPENGFPFLACNNEDSDYTFLRGDIPDNNLTDTLTLKECGISELSIGCFYGFPTLSFLDISYNRVKTLRFGIFNKLSKLWKLDLSYNLIADLPADVFDNIPFLGELCLAGNRLAHLTPDALKRGHTLRLSNNNLQGANLDTKSFDSRELWSLYLDNNNMEGAPDDMMQNTPNLTWLSLRNCSLVEIPKYIRTLNLTDLFMDSNKIRYITNLADFNDLNNLELSNNLIEEIDENTFLRMKKLMILNLRGNRIQTVNVDLFRGLSHLKRLDLANNRITFLENNFLNKLKNSEVSLSYFGFDKNPWQCACLKDLLQEAFSLDIIYDSERHDGRHVLCVAVVKLVCHRNANYWSIWKEMTN